MKQLRIPISAHISLATEEDVPALIRIINRAYRGEASQQGWTTEAHLIGGEVRIDETGLKHTLTQPGSVILLYKENDELLGSLNLQANGDSMYLGLFNVEPNNQGKGIGKQLLSYAEEFARQNGYATMEMKVISVRTELIDWYKRHGYQDAGIRIPFEEDGVSGNHLQPLEFMVLKKQL